MLLFAVSPARHRPLIRPGSHRPLGRYRLVFGVFSRYCLGVVHFTERLSMKVLQPAGSMAASGSVAGTTYSRNRFGSYAKRKSTPVNPNTTFQNAVRSAFSTLAARWSTLTAPQRSAWQTYSNSVPRSDTFGQPIVIDGRQMYIGCNSLRLQAGLSIVDAGPTILTLPGLTLPVPTITAGDPISLAFTGTDDWANEVGGALLLYTTDAKSPQTNYCKGPYRYAGKVAGAATPPTSPATVAAPHVYTAGQKIFWKAVAVMADGRQSAASYGSVFCGA